MLNTKQKQLITYIIEFGNITKACIKVKVERKTYYEWLKNEEFATELKLQQDNVYNNALIELKSLFNEAIDTYKVLLSSEDESIKFRTATAIIDNTVKLIENKELQERIEALEAATEEKKG